MQSVAREGLEVLADQGEAEIYEAQDLGSSLGDLGSDVDVPLPRLDDDDILGPVARIFQRPAAAKDSVPPKDEVTADEYVNIVMFTTCFIKVGQAKAHDQTVHPHTSSSFTASH